MFIQFFNSISVTLTLTFVTFFVSQSISQNTEDTIQKINMDIQSQWKKDSDGVTRIKVSWESFSESTREERDWVKDAIENSWEKYSNVEFYYWGEYDESGQGIRIYVSDTAHPKSYIGNRLDGLYHGMQLNFNWDGAKIGTREFRARTIAIHEFGHALGFAHEQDRKDCTCDESQEKNIGGYYVTPCDIKSVMNYCNPVWNNGGALSKYDIEGIRLLYGNKPTYKAPPISPENDIKNDITPSGYITTVERLMGKDMIWEKLQLKIGTGKFNFDLTMNSPSKTIPLVIDHTGSYNYSITSSYQGSDSIEYTQDGFGFLYLEKGKTYKLVISLGSGSSVTRKLLVQRTEIDPKTGNPVNPFGYPYSKPTKQKLPEPNIESIKKKLRRKGNLPTHVIATSIVSPIKSALYIYEDDIVMELDLKSNLLLRCGKKRKPFYNDTEFIQWDWSFWRIRNRVYERYSVDIDGNVWIYTNSQFKNVGRIVPCSW